MSKVFIVTNYWYSGDSGEELLGIYSSLSLANAKVESFKGEGVARGVKWGFREDGTLELIAEYESWESKIIELDKDIE